MGPLLFVGSRATQAFVFHVSLFPFLRLLAKLKAFFLLCQSLRYALAVLCVGRFAKKTVLQFCFAERFFIFILQYGFCCNKSLLALPVA